MWNGTFAKRSFTDHFKIVNVEHFDDVVQVTISFDKTPGQTYAFDIPKDKYEYRKEVIAEQILSQLRS